MFGSENIVADSDSHFIIAQKWT